MGPSRSIPRVVALAATLAAGAVCSGARSAPAPLHAPPLQLVETIPVETSLGDPTLPQAADVWVEMIEGAKRSIDLEHFYLSHWPGESTGPVLDAIGRAAKRGVRVRVLLDAGMHATYPQPADSLGRLPGVRVRLLDMKKVSGGGVQHAKFMIVDGEQIFVGSQNLDWRALKHIHELGVRARDPRIADPFSRVFESDWNAAAPSDTTATDPPAPTETKLPSPALPIRLAQSPGDTVAAWPSFSPKGHIPEGMPWDLDELVRLLDGARSEAVVQLLTYGLGRGDDRDSTLDAALRRAAARGVKVKLLVSDWVADNARISDLVGLSQVANVEARLSVVPEWSGGYIPFARVEHCKYLVVDTLWTWVGTSNWEPGYFRRSRGAALTLLNRPLAARARGIFETSWRSPTARIVRANETYAPRIHRETPPPGKRAYGK